MIRASISVPSHLSIHMKQDELQDYVLSSLAKHISYEISKKMTVDKQYDPLTDSVTYTGSVVATQPNTITVSGFNGTMSGATISSAANNYSQINLRVIEYTKNGKVTRVELQRYDVEGDMWCKIPRLQIEE